MAWVLQAGSRSVSFGCDMTGMGLMAQPRVKPLVESAWVVNPRRDGRRPGRQYRSGQVVSLEVEARPDERPMVEVWREFLAVWRADEVRGTAGALATLTADSGRRAYGVPGEIGPDEQYRIFDANRASVDFECVDDLWYGPEEQTAIRFTVASGGGLRFPARAPFRFTSEGATRNAAVVVAGDVPTWPVFEIHGPVTNPEVEVQGVGRLQFQVSLAYDRFLRVDTRPWARWVQAGFKDNPDELSPMPGALSPSGARLSDMALAPGSYTVLLRGFDATGTAELRVSQWPAYTSF